MRLSFPFRPLNALRFQNLTAVSPSGSPSRVRAKLECRLIPQVVKYTSRPCASLRTEPLLTSPTAAISSRL